MAASDLVFFHNEALTDADTSGQTSTVGEPSVANNGRQIFVTGNWYASRSLDAGASWIFTSPFNTLPPVDGGFCCDQTTLYEPSRDLVVWLLQYIELGGRNALRVAVKRGETLGNNVWHWWDLVPEEVDPDWAGEWFDYNHAATSNNFLYVATNAFDTQDRFTRSVVFRLSLDELAAGASLGFDLFQTSDNFSLRCTQGAREIMYFGSHNTAEQLRVFSWPESSTTVSAADVDVTRWSAGNYVASGPDGRNWLERCDSRITGAWLARGVVGFLWTANARGARPFPHVRAVRIDELGLQLVDEPDVWSPDFAYAYPDACPNDRGHVGLTLFRGGGAIHPGHVVGIQDDFSTGWELAATRDGSHGPGDLKWGDYLTCRRHSPDGLTWIAAGYTLQGGSTRNEIEPRLVHFGRERERGAVERWLQA
ncbi:MAG TPA: hypothetical protein VMV46_04390 [Thermoanaerobaculia bacterium]|nr:hypothetical protein [Thermoanaerobaculia bacterium]